MSNQEHKPLTEWADEKSAAVQEENREIARSNRLLRMQVAEREEELKEVQRRLGAYEHPSAFRVERMFAKQASITGEDISREINCGPEESAAILADLGERGYNVVDGVVSRVASGRRATVEHFYGDVVRFGVVSDTHIGNHHSMEDELHEAYAVFEQEGIDRVYTAGNLVDGEKTYAGQEYEINVMGVDNVVTNLARVWPQVPGITTYHIASSTCHEGYYLKSAGILLGKLIESERPDMVYLGLDEADVVLHPGERKPRLRLIHPGGGTGYADSYRPQKIVESYAGGDKPDILVVGHYHKAGYYPIRDVDVIQAGCLERQTPFMRKRSLRAVLGFWIVEARFTEHGSLRRFNSEFFKYHLDADGNVIKRWGA